MTNENVETLYGKYEKKVAKKKRAELKRAFASGRDDKFETVNTLNMRDLHPLRKTKGLIGWVATFLGCLFLVLNLVVYSYAVPVYNGYGTLAGKVGTDFEAYSAKANGDFEAKANAAIEAGVNSAYLIGIERAQSYLNELNNSKYQSVPDLQNKLTEVLAVYSDYKDVAALYQDKYAAKITTENELNAAKVEYSQQKEEYLALLSEYESALIEFARTSGAYNDIPEFVYADLKAAYDDATEKYEAVVAEYVEEELTELRETYKNALSVRDKAIEDLEEAKNHLTVATDKKVADDAEVKSAQVALQQALDEYNAQIDIGAYDLEVYKKAVEKAQAALSAATQNAQTAIDEEIETAQNAVDTAKKALNNAETTVNSAKTAILNVLQAEETVAAAEKKLNDAKNNYLSLSELDKAKLVYDNADDESKAELTAKKDELSKAEWAALPLINAEKAFAFAENEFSEAEATLTEVQNELFGCMDNVINLTETSFDSSVLFDKVGSNYKTTVNSYLKLLAEQKDIENPEIIIDRFLEKNLTAFDTAINGLADFLVHAYTLVVFENDIVNYDYSVYGSLNNAINVALSEFKTKYDVYTDACAAYENLYKDYAALCKNYNKATETYMESQSDENKVALDTAEIAFKLAEATYKNSLVAAVNEVALTKAEANAYLNRLNSFISVYGRVATEAEPLLNEVYLYVCELTGEVNEVKLNPSIDGKVMLDYTWADESTRNAVLGRYNIGDCVVNSKAYFAAVKEYGEYLKILKNYTDCGELTDGDLAKLELSAELVQSICDEFDAVTKKLNSDGGSLYTDAQSYASAAKTYSIIFMVYDIVMAVILFVYCLYWLLGHRSEAMEENFNSIINALKD